MEEPEKACHKQDKKKMAINIGKVGGGGGLGGIIFLAGVLATAAVASAFAVKRRHQKSRSNKNNNQQSSPGVSNETVDDSNNDEATKGLQILVSDISPEGHHQLSNGITRTAVSKTDVNCLVTAESLILDDEKMASGIDGGKGGPISIDEDVLLGTCSEKAASSPLDDDSMIKKEEFPSPKIDNLLDFEPDSMKKHVPEMEIQVIRHHDAIEAILVDQVEAEDNHNMEVHTDEKQVEEDQNYDGDISYVKLEADEIATGGWIMQKIQLGEQQETPTSVAQEKITTDCSIQESTEVDGEELLLPPFNNLSFNKDDKEGSAQFGGDEVIEREEAIEAAEGVQIKDNADFALNEKQVENSDQHDEEIFIEKCDEAGEIKKADQSALISNDVENTFFDEPSPESRQDGDYGIEEPNSLEIFHNICHLEPGNLICNISNVNQQPTDHIEVIDEHVAKEWFDREGMVEEEGNLTIQLVEKQQSDDDSEGNTVGHITEAPENISVDIVTAEDDPVAQMIDEAENAKDNEIDDYDDGDGNDIVMAEDYPFPRMSDEAENAKDNEIDYYDDDGDDMVTEEDDPIAQMSDEAENAKDNEIDEYNDDGDDIVMTEDDPIARLSDEAENGKDNEIDDYDDDEADEVNSADKVEASSEETGDSSAESNAEAIWPTETIQELSMALDDVKLSNQKEERNNKEEETAEAEDNIYYKCVEDANNIANGNRKNNSKGKFKSSFVEKCMMEFAAQHDLILKSTKWRMLIGTVSVLLWSLGFRYFGSPFVKLSLIVILVTILSRVHGI